MIREKQVRFEIKRAEKAFRYLKRPLSEEESEVKRDTKGDGEWDDHVDR
jgi:hypothetical protein